MGIGIRSVRNWFALVSLFLVNQQKQKAVMFPYKKKIIHDEGGRTHMGKTKAKWPRFVSLRHKILLSLIFVSLFVTIGTAFCSYMLATNRVKNIGMRLSRQNITSVSTDLSIDDAECRTTHTLTVAHEP